MSTPVSRRSFVKGAAVALAGLPLRSRLVAAESASSPAAPPPAEVRAYWITVAERLAAPILTNLAARTLKKNMPVEQRPTSNHAGSTHLEGFGRLMCGIAPWLDGDKPEKWVGLAREALDAATDPESPDFLNFKNGSQPLVDTAFLAQGLLRGRKTLWDPLDGRVKKNVVEALKSSRVIRPGENNWLLFAATVEAFLHTVGEPIVRERVAHALTKHKEWYKGDGVYGDGPSYHCDYYNSYVIQPMLVDVTTVFADDNSFDLARDLAMKRARRYAAIQERQISPEGAYPVIGRSSAYRFGAFHALAQIAWLRELPRGVSPAQVRCAMTAVFRRQLAAPGNFDASGWLRIGFCGHQPGIGDSYVSTGSLYMCAAALLPLGLPATDPFWSDPDAPWTQAKAWSGVDIPGDHAIA